MEFKVSEQFIAECRGHHDRRNKNSYAIFESHRFRRLEGSKRKHLLLLLSLLLAVCAIVIVTLLQFDEFNAYANGRFDYLNKTKVLCPQIRVSNINITSTPISIILLLIYVVLYKRRTFLVAKFKYKNIGLPMMISMWKKNDRLFSAFTYGTIAFNIYNIVKNYLNQETTSKSLVNVNDITKTMPLLIKIVEVFLIGIRYYPILVANRVNSAVVCLLATLYMW